MLLDMELTTGSQVIIDKLVEDLESARDNVGSVGAGANAGNNAHAKSKEARPFVLGNGPKQTVCVRRFLEKKAGSHDEADQTSDEADQTSDGKKYPLGGSTCKYGYPKCASLQPLASRADGVYELEAGSVQKPSFAEGTNFEERGPVYLETKKAAFDVNDLSLSELEAARRDIIARAHDRAILKSREDSTLLASVINERPLEAAPNTMVIDVDGPQLSVSSGQASLCLPAMSGNCLDLPDISLSNTEERTAEALKNLQPVVDANASVGSQFDMGTMVTGNIPNDGDNTVDRLDVPLRSLLSKDNIHMTNTTSFGAASTYVLSKRSMQGLEVGITVKKSRTSIYERIVEGLVSAATLEYPFSDSLHISEDASIDGTNGRYVNDVTSAMVFVDDWTENCIKHIITLRKEEDASAVPSACLFCGLLGHSILECSETREHELHDLYTKLAILDSGGLNREDSYCLRCLTKGHWAAECVLEAPHKARDTKFKLQMQLASHRNECEKNDQQECSPFTSHGSIANGPIQIVRSTLMMLESIRLSRADILKWASCREFSWSVKGFFLRLRLGKWEKELGGTGYRMACIKGAYRKARLGVERISVLVDLGDVECTIDTQYISNQGFTEGELAHWYRATEISGKLLPQDKELQAKLNERQAWPC